MQNKNYKSVLMAVLALLLFSFQSCGFDVNAVKGDGNVVSRDTEVGFFDAIEASGMFRIILEKGTQPGVRVTTDENLHEYITVKVQNNTLELSMRRNQTYNPTRLEVFVTYTDLQRINMSGATSLSADDPIETQRLELDLSGAGELKLQVATQVLRTSVSGAGSIQIEGNAAQHHMQLSGAASVKCADLITRETIISLSGAGSADVYATETLHATLSGVGSIRYGGDPENTRINKSGLGTIRPL